MSSPLQRMGVFCRREVKKEDIYSEKELYYKKSNIYETVYRRIWERFFRAYEEEVIRA
jgi:hypothetical protein